MLDLIPDPAIIFDSRWRLAGANQRAAHLFRGVPESMVGLPVGSLFRGVDIKGLRRVDQNTMLELTGIRVGGDSFPVEASFRPVKRNNDRHVIVVLRDATKRVRADMLRAAEHEVLEHVANGEPMRAAVLRLTRLIESVSPGLIASVLLASPNGDELSERIAPSLPQSFTDELPRVPVGPAELSSGAAAFHRKLVVSADIATDPLWSEQRGLALAHGLRACWASPIVDSENRVLGTFSMYYRQPRSPNDEELDLVARATRIARIAIERDRHDQHRRQTESRYRTLSELTSDFAYAFRFDDDGAPHVEWVTDAFSRITGYEVAEWETIGAWAGIIHPDDRLAFEQRLSRLERGDEVSSELRILTKWGDVRWLSVYSRPILSDGKLAGIVGAAQDFTSRKEAEDSKTMFLATASHELKTPLTVIQGFAQLMGTDHSPGSELGREAAVTIDRRAKELGKILERILLSSRIETGKVHPTIEDVEIAGILRERVGSFSAAVQRDVALELEDIPAVRADVNALATIIDHLLDNAVKYSPNGGAVTVKAERRSEFVRVAVTDEGIGMTLEQRKRCFEKFWQADSADSRRFGGTGIGLFIVRSLIEAMGGEVTVESELGRGSTFAFTVRTTMYQGSREAFDQPGPGLGERNSIAEFMRQMGVPQVNEVGPA